MSIWSYKFDNDPRYKPGTILRVDYFCFVTDDRGQRIDLEKFPLFVLASSFRNDTNIALTLMTGTGKIHDVTFSFTSFLDDYLRLA